MRNALALAAAVALAAPPHCEAAGLPALSELSREAGVEQPPLVAEPPVRAPLIVSLNAHAHFTDELSFFPIPFPEGKLFEPLRAEMQAASIQTAFLLSDAYLSRGDDPQRYGLNEELSRFIMAHPGPFRGFCGIDSAWADRDRILKTCLELPGMIGVKMHFRWHRKTLADPDERARFESLLETADPYRAVFLLHMNFDVDEAAEVEQLFKLARQHPNLTFIVAHAGEDHFSALESLGRMLDAAGGGNILTETSTVEIRDHAKAAAALKAFGIARVLFGVDNPLYGSKRAVEAFMGMPLTDDDKDAILYRNGMSLLAELAAGRSIAR